MLEIGKSQSLDALETVSDRQICDKCKVVDANIFCNECNCCYCHECSAFYHAPKRNRHHRLVTMGSEQSLTELRRSASTQSVSMPEDCVPLPVLPSPAPKREGAASKVGIKLVRKPSSMITPDLPLTTTTAIDPTSAGIRHVGISALGTQRIEWERPPSNVLIIKKPKDIASTELTCHVVQELISRGINVLLEIAVIAEIEHVLSTEERQAVLPIPSNPDDFNAFHYCGSSSIDFVVTLGGDGTVIYAVNMFRKAVPPVVPVNMGSLGFLTPFTRTDILSNGLNTVLNGRFLTLLRDRLSCIIFQKSVSAQPKTLTVLNEVAVQRSLEIQHLCSTNGNFIENLILKIDGIPATRIVGDGVLIATATGSTAYSLSAGGCCVHPAVPSVLITPIASQMLSLRPIIVPLSSKIELIVDSDSSTSIFCTFDGRNTHELKNGDSIVILSSPYPVPCVAKQSQIRDWFSSLTSCLNWNIRPVQKSMAKPPKTNTFT
ncbi:hypothetical protein PCE1_004906 [Barthelona sp. PCE]